LGGGKADVPFDWLSGGVFPDVQSAEVGNVDTLVAIGLRNVLKR